MSTEHPSPEQKRTDFDKDLESLIELRATVRLSDTPRPDIVFLLSFIDKLWAEYTRTLQQLDDEKYGPLFTFPTRRETEKAMEAMIPTGWCPICGGQNGEHKPGCEDGSEIL